MALVNRALQYGFTSSFRPLWGEMARFRDTVGRDDLPAMFGILGEYEGQAVEYQEPRQAIVEEARSIASRANPVKVAVFSVNLRSTILTGLTKLGLSSTIYGLVGSDDVNYWKPEPEGLEQLMREASVKPQETLFIGDRQGDMEAAETADVEFVWA